MSNTETRLCLNCGSPFSVRLSPSREGRGKFCSQSCGARKNNMRHGHTTHSAQSGTYTSYMNMLGRCHRPGHSKFPSYGAVGITVCQRWRDSFSNFLEDMGERPKGKTLDRFPNGAGNYEPGNCRWATPAEQQSNMKSNITIEFRGQTLILSEWARRFGIEAGVIRYRLKAGWPLEKALTHKPWARPSEL